jgi:peptide/nickel transport system substrate-binding protein
MTKTASRRLLLKASACAPFLGIGARGAWAASPGAPLRMRINADIRSTEPGVNRDETTDAVVLHMVEGLVAFREDTSVGPLLASSYDISPDGKTYTFHLRTGVKFHNGATMTADHVVWTWKRYLDPATQWRGVVDFTSGLNKIVDIKTLDPATVAFTLAQPSALFLTNMARTDCGGSGILHPDSVGSDGQWSKPVGTGPFMFGAWQKGLSVTLDKFSEYSSLAGPPDGYTGGKKAEVAGIVFTVIPDNTAADTALESGDIDAIWPFSPTDFAQLKSRPGIKMDEHPVLDMYTLLFQTKDPLLADARIRRAIAMAIDGKMLSEGVSQGLSYPNQSPVPSGSPYYSAVQRKGYPVDLPGAGKLLKEAGYHGQPITMMANKHYMPMYDAAVLIQAMLQQIGVVVNIEVLDWATQLSNYVSGNYQAMTFGYSPRLDPSLTFDSFMGNKSIQPRKIWDDPTAQKLLTASMVERDHQKRQALFDQLTTLFWQQMPMVPLFNSDEITALRSNVDGYRGWAAGNARFWNVSLG